MRKNLTLLVCLGMTSIVLWAGAARAIPPKPDIPEDALKRSLAPEYQKPVNERIVWWKDLLVNARKSSEIIDARKGLMADYALYQNERYQSYFAWDSVKNFKDLLEGKGYNANDALIEEKELHIAIALSGMAQKQAVPALDTMIASKNEGLRYLGWKGYDGIVGQLLEGGVKPAEYLIKIIADGLQTETNPVIIKKIFQVIETACKTQSISTTTMRGFRSNILEAFEKAWPIWRAKVQEGLSAEMIDMSSDAVTSLVSVVMLKLSDLSSEDKAKILQMILDQAYSDSLTYDRLLQAAQTKFANITDEKSRNRQIEENLALQQACSSLLLACEEGLGKLSGDKKTPIQDALNTEVAKGAAVRGSILAWATALKKQGVKDPVPAAEKKSASTPTPPVEK